MAYLVEWQGRQWSPLSIFISAVVAYQPNVGRLWLNAQKHIVVVISKSLVKPFQFRLCFSSFSEAQCQLFGLDIFFFFWCFGNLPVSLTSRSTKNLIYYFSLSNFGYKSQWCSPLGDHRGLETANLSWVRMRFLPRSHVNKTSSALLMAEA
jgi:hypothetical protein